MGSPTSYDWQALGLAALAGVVLGVGLGFKPPAGRGIWLALVGFAAGTLGLAAGFYAQHTRLRGIVGALLGWNPWVALVLTLALAGLIVLAVAALAPFIHDAAVTPAIVIVLILAPVVFGLNPMPGRFDSQALAFLHGIAKPTLTLMAGEFGAV